MAELVSDDEASLRLDVWLWRTRLCKTRAEATALARAGKVRIKRTGQSALTDKPAFKVRLGDVLTFVRHAQVHCVQVTALPPRRISAPERASTYDDLTERHPDNVETPLRTEVQPGQ